MTDQSNGCGNGKEGGGGGVTFNPVYEIKAISDYYTCMRNTEFHKMFRDYEQMHEFDGSSMSWVFLGVLYLFLFFFQILICCKYVL